MIETELHNKCEYLDNMMLFFHPGDFKHAAPVHCFVPWNFGLIRTNVLLFVQPYKAYPHIVRHHFNLLLCWVRNVISLYYESYFAEHKASGTVQSRTLQVMSVKGKGKATIFYVDNS